MVCYRLLAICLVLFFCTGRLVSAEEISENMEHRLQPLLPKKAEWALAVVDLESGQELAGVGNALEKKLVPASLMKLITTGAVFEYAEHGAVMEKKVAAVVSDRRHKGKKRRRQIVTRAVQIRDQEQLCNVLRDMNVHSRNGVAQSLAEQLGERRFGPPETRHKGARALCDFLNSLNLPAGEASIADGCGLLRENRLTARFLACYLQEVARKPWFNRFRETLPRPGLEGTVRRIGYTNPRFRVKTGHLYEVFSLAGYGVDDAGRECAFAFIVNVPGGRASDFGRSRAEVLRMLAAGVPRSSGPTNAVSSVHLP